MHDLDRVMFEQPELSGESAQSEFLEVLGELSGESYEVTGEVGYETGPVQHLIAQDRESHETQLATELLEITSEQELDRFLGDLMSSAVGAARSFASSPTGQQLGGILKNAAKQALPVVGGAIGNYVAPGGSGQTWGSRIGSAAGDLFGLELEGLSNEDRELEVARSFVNFADLASKYAAQIARTTDATSAAVAAAQRAARQAAPGLVRVVSRPAAPVDAGNGDHGTWERRNGVIVLFGA